MGLKEWLLDHVLGGVLVSVTLLVLGWAWPFIGIWGFALGLALLSNVVLAFNYVRLRRPKRKVLRRYTIRMGETEESHPLAFRVQLERIPDVEEAHVSITTGFLCGEDYYGMVLVGSQPEDVTEHLTSDVIFQEWACPKCGKTARTRHGARGDVHAHVKALALGRFHNGEPSDPPLQRR